MANNITPKLKAFVRIDGTGRVIPGSPIFQAQKPKVGNWREVPLYYRGDSTTTSTSTSTSTTTSTSTSTTTTTTTATPSYTYNLKSGVSSFSVCSGSVNLTLYGQAANLNVGLQLFTDSGLTTTYAPGATILIGYGDGVGAPVWQVNTNGVIELQAATC